ncbi:MAG: hypothetical protein SGJ11_13640 [Phycisphaerae bacterium]|nr:hypothetical protein [Phycisphaerae bacterium]
MTAPHCVRRIAAVGAALVALVSTLAVAPLGGGFDLSWHTVDGGGETFSVGSGFVLGGTIGQPDAGAVMTGGAFALTGGFWPGAEFTSGVPCFSDFNADGVVDATDLAVLLGGWGVDGPADLSGDGIVNSVDLALLLGAWGPCL